MQLETGQEGGTAEEARPESVWRNRNVVLLWAAQLVSQFGDFIFFVAIIWMALEITGDNGTAGLVVMCAHLPMILFSLVSGSLVDRWNRRRTMIAADAARCGLLLLFPLLYSAGALGVLAVAALAFSVESFSSLFNPARDVLLAEVTPRRQLTAANSLVQSAVPFAMVAGPALAGAIMPLVGIAHLFTVDAATFAVSMLFLLAIRADVKKVEKERKPLLSDVAEGIRYAVRHPVIGWLLIITAVDNWFVMGLAIIGLPIFVREIIGPESVVLGLTLAAGQVYALAFSFFAVGFIICTPLIGRLPQRMNRGRVILLGIFLDGATYVPLAWITDPAHLLALMFLHGLTVPLITVTRTAMIQEMVPPGLRGRVFSMVNLTVFGLMALSVGATGFITGVIRVDHLFGLWGGIAALLGPIGWLVPKLREAGKPEAA